jgi:hypothetical protein
MRPDQREALDELDADFNHHHSQMRCEEYARVRAVIRAMPPPLPEPGIEFTEPVWLYKQGERLAEEWTGKLAEAKKDLYERFLNLERLVTALQREVVDSRVNDGWKERAFQFGERISQIQLLLPEVNNVNYNQTAKIARVVPQMEMDVRSLKQDVHELIEKSPTATSETFHRIMALESKVENLQESSVRYEGVWSESKLYARGALTTHGGSMWLCLKPMPQGKPGQDPASWKLTVKSK